MAIQFSDTTNFRGLAQMYAEEIGMNNPVDLTGNTDKMKKFTAKVNNALDRYFAIAVQSGGTWQVDDTNHGDYQAIYATLTSGRKDYKFLTDETGNAILDIYKVLVLPSSTATTYVELEPVDETLNENIDFLDENGVTGVPDRYSKRSNAIFLDKAPNYTVARGIKVLVNRESSYFTYTDTTKKPGFPYYQEYFYLKPAYEYARINNLANLPRLEQEILKLEGDESRGLVGLIAQAYSHREKDVRKVMTGKKLLYI